MAKEATSKTEEEARTSGQEVEDLKGKEAATREEEVETESNKKVSIEPRLSLKFPEGEYLMTH